jgi:D-aminopeptidase
MDRLFVPVGLTETASIPSDLQITPGMATLHAPWPDGGWRRGLFPSHELLGEGAIVSTLDDMLRWTAHLRSRDKLGAPGSWAELVKPPTFANGALGEYALGLILRNYRGLRTIHHPGGVIGGSSQMMTVPDHDLDIIILANGAPGANPPRLAEQVIDIVLADLIGDAPSMISAADYQPLLGDWQSLETGLIYSLRDVEGRLCLELCKAWLFALPLVRKGNEVMAVSDSLGPVKVDLDRALATGELIITFGGRSTAYAHGVKTTSDQAVFASAVAGHFSSADAGADLTIKPLGDRLVVRISDGYGVVECDLICASDRLGYFAAPPPAIWFWSILRFNIVDGAATGFQLNSVRTRNLEFKRVEDWSRP